MKTRNIIEFDIAIISILAFFITFSLYFILSDTSAVNASLSSEKPVMKNH